MKNSLIIVCLVALVSAPILAGCASNSTTPTPTPSTSTTATPTTTATPSSTPTPTVTPPATGGKLELKMGVMMPLTGALNTLGPDMQKGAQLAIKEINDASATTGLHITEYDEDDKTTDSAGAPNTLARLVGNGVTVVAGPCCSGVTAAILDKAIESGVVISSPSATSPSLTLSRDNQGYFWRVSPSDAVQGKVLANVVKDDSIASVAMIYVNNAYGTGLKTVFTDSFGASKVLGTPQAYNEVNSGDFSAQVTAVCGTSAQGLVIFGYITDGANMLKEMSKQGCLSKFKIYGSEGLYNSATDKGLPATAGKDSAGNFLANGVKGTNPESGNTTVFNAKFKAAYSHDPAQYSAESYDAVMYLALGALKAGSVKAADIKEHMLEIANAPGTKCSSFAACATLIKTGADVDYQGAAHDFEFDANHEPKTGIYDVWQVQSDGTTKIVATGKSA